MISLYVVLQMPVNKVSESIDSSVCYSLTTSKVDRIITQSLYLNFLPALQTTSL